MRACLLFLLASSAGALEIRPKDVLYEVSQTNYALSHGKPIFYQIVMGSFPFRKQYKLWLGMLRQNGKYDGTVLIVTDKPGCVANGLGEQLLGGAKLPESDDHVDIYPGTGNGKVHILKVKTPRSVLGIKMHKGRAWNNLKLAKVDHEVSSIVYTDTDVFVAEDVNQWLGYANGLAKRKHSLALFPDIGQLEDATQNLHTGVVVMFPTKASQRCIIEWSKQLGGGDDDPAPINHFGSSLIQKDMGRDQLKVKGVDQQALVKTRACHKHGAPDPTDGVFTMPSSYLSFPGPKELHKGKTSLFMHITNTGRWKQTSEEEKATFFYKKLKVSKEIDFMTKGHCPREMWDTKEYKLRQAKPY